MLKEMKQR